MNRHLVSYPRRLAREALECRSPSQGKNIFKFSQGAIFTVENASLVNALACLLIGGTSRLSSWSEQGRNGGKENKGEDHGCALEGPPCDGGRQAGRPQAHRGRCSEPAMGRCSRMGMCRHSPAPVGSSCAGVRVEAKTSLRKSLLGNRCFCGAGFLHTLGLAGGGGAWV